MKKLERFNKKMSALLETASNANSNDKELLEVSKEIEIELEFGTKLNNLPISNKILSALARNPNTPIELLIKLGKDFLKDITHNPVLELILLERPNCVRSKAVLPDIKLDDIV